MRLIRTMIPAPQRSDVHVALAVWSGAHLLLAIINPRRVYPKAASVLDGLLEAESVSINAAVFTDSQSGQGIIYPARKPGAESSNLLFYCLGWIRIRLRLVKFPAAIERLQFRSQQVPANLATLASGTRRYDRLILRKRD